MDTIIIVLIISYIIVVANIFVILLNNQKKAPTTPPAQYQNKPVKNYRPKPFLTNIERYFWNVLVELERRYPIKIQPQTNLATIIDKVDHKNKYCTELFRNIDFAIFDEHYQQVLLLIEINDESHNQPARRERDKKVKEICSNAGIKLITFYAKYPNQKYYIQNRVLKELGDKIATTPSGSVSSTATLPSSDTEFRTKRRSDVNDENHLVRAQIASDHNHPSSSSVRQ